ncbi:sporulation protein [Brevibacillus dissolubilis]|uniref:sporulation protein n=1 Tax=Brevibacillus dissolubilis TaxID=1844116 RepID=UPI0011167B8D|nr:sporulation protein [Brevibacillus dissolubilis]
MVNLFSKLISRFTAGNASIDLVLDKNIVETGECLHGTFIVRGSGSRQKVNHIEVDLRAASKYYDENGHLLTRDESIHSVRVIEAFTIEADETLELDFSFDIPKYMPFTSLTTRFYFKTNLDVSFASDAQDVDHLTILPVGIVKNFMEGMKLLGCQLIKEAYVHPYQEMRFQCTDWMRGIFDEFEFNLNPYYSHAVVGGLFELDKRLLYTHFGSKMDELDFNEIEGIFSFTEEQMATPEKAAETTKEFVEEVHRRIMYQLTGK